MTKEEPASDLKRVEKDDGTAVTKFFHDAENLWLETDDSDVKQVVYHRQYHHGF